MSKTWYPIAEKKQKVNNRTIALLREAIDDAEAWRGGIDPDSWGEFDEHIQKMRDALDNVKHDRKLLRSML